MNLRVASIGNQPINVAVTVRRANAYPTPDNVAMLLNS